MHFAPIVKLPPVELKTNEEEEKELFKMCDTHSTHTHTLVYDYGYCFVTGEQSCSDLTIVQRLQNGKNVVWEMSSLWNTRQRIRTYASS